MLLDAFSSDAKRCSTEAHADCEDRVKPSEALYVSWAVKKFPRTYLLISHGCVMVRAAIVNPMNCVESSTKR